MKKTIKKADDFCRKHWPEFVVWLASYLEVSLSMKLIGIAGNAVVGEQMTATDWIAAVALGTGMLAVLLAAGYVPIWFVRERSKRERLLVLPRIKNWNHYNAEDRHRLEHILGCCFGTDDSMSYVFVPKERNILSVFAMNDPKIPVSISGMGMALVCERKGSSGESAAPLCAEDHQGNERFRILPEVGGARIKFPDQADIRVECTEGTCWFYQDDDIIARTKCNQSKSESALSPKGHAFYNECVLTEDTSLTDIEIMAIISFPVLWS